jgi:hypothetical protein
MKIRITIATLLLAVSSISHGQAVPTATTSMVPSNSGLTFSPLDGVFHYALTASEIAQRGYYGPSEWTSSTALSGNASYAAKSTVHPFNMVFAGGVSLPNQSAQSTTSFWNISASQGYVTRKWIFNVSDSFSFLNFVNASPTSGAINDEQISGTVALNRRLDARSSVSLDAVYSTFTYSGAGSVLIAPDIETRGLNLAYQRLLSRSLSVSVSAGPQWVSSSNSALVPSNLNVAATAAVEYSRGNTNGSISYSRGVNSGSGVLPGALADTVGGSLAHSYGRNWVASINAAYTHTAGLTQLIVGSPIAPVNSVYETVFGGAQVTRRISTHLSGYLSYTAQNQSSNFSVPGQNSLNGTSHTFGIGITFSPRSTRLGQF